MDTHRSRSLGMAALIFILISLTVAVFHGAAPVRADDVTTPTPIEINGDTATVEVKLYTDENHTQELNGAVTSTSKLYGAFSAQFKSGEAPSPENYIAVYELPGTIVVDDNAGGNLMEGPEATADKAGTWKIEGGNNSISNIKLLTCCDGWELFLFRDARQPNGNPAVITLMMCGLAFSMAGGWKFSMMRNRGFHV